MISVAQPLAKDSNLEPKRARMEIQPELSFLNEDKVETMQPYDDALVVTFKLEAV